MCARCIIVSAIYNLVLCKHWTHLTLDIFLSASCTTMAEGQSATSLMLRVVITENDVRKFMLPSGIPDSVDELVGKIQTE